MSYPKFTKTWPIVSGNDCLTEQASQLVDDYLHPHVRAFTSYIQNTMDLLRAPNSISVPERAWLLAVDVEALYNLIPRVLGVQVVEGFISERGIPVGPYNEFILDLLRFVFFNNIFMFEYSHYFQVQGVVIRNHCAPS